MATLPAIPPVPDQDRVLFLNVTSPTTTVNVPFPVYGAQEDLQVIVNFDTLDDADWTFTSASGTPLNLLPLPITDGVVTFTTPVVAGTIEIIGNYQPRQVIQPSAPGISRREFNQTTSSILSCLREVARALRITPNFVQTDTAGDGFYDAQQHLISNVADAVSQQDAVNLETLTAVLQGFVLSGGVSQLNNVALTGTGSQTVFSIAALGTLSSIALSYLVTANGLLIDPNAYTISVAGATIAFATPPANGADIQVRLTGFARTLSNIATQAQAIAGVDNSTTMTPLRVAQAVAADLVAFLASTPAFTSAVAGLTASPGDNTTKLSTTAFVTAAVTAFLSSNPAFSAGASGVTASVADNTTKLATTAFVQANVVPAIAAGTTALAVGAYCNADTSTVVAPGGTLAGSSLTTFNSNSATSQTLTGTWRFMGSSQSASVVGQLWLRIA